MNLEDKVAAEEAAGWLVRLEQDASEQCRAQFTAWLEKSPRNMGEFLLVTAAYKELDGIDAGRTIDVEELTAGIAHRQPNEVVRLANAHPTLAPSLPMGRRRSVGKVFGWAAAVAIVAVSGWLVLSSIIAPSYKTAVGEQRTVKLDDGSVMQMNTQSQAEVRFSDRVRDVRLEQGEALFVVEKDARRPFRVLTDSAVIQALGTQFNVYRHDGATTVTVLEGLVRIENAQGRQDLAAGEAAHIGKDGQIAKEAKAEVTKAVAWRQRKLDFRGTPLAEVAAEFNRYNPLQLQVENGAASEKQLNGVFNADEPQALLKFLEQDAALQFERTPAGIFIRMR